MTLYGYARVSVREPEDKNLDLQVERLVRAGCAMGNIRAEEASGAKDDRGGLLELLDLVVESDTLVVTHIDRLSRGLTFGLQVIEGLHHSGVEFRSLAEDFDTSTANGKLQLQMVLAFSEWWRNSIRDRSVAGQAKARTEGRFPGRRPSLTEQQRECIREERSRGVSQRELAKRLEVSRWTIQQVDGEELAGNCNFDAKHGQEVRCFPVTNHPVLTCAVLLLPGPYCGRPHIEPAAWYQTRDNGWPPQ